jgi:hypothetical protein
VLSATALARDDAEIRDVVTVPGNVSNIQLAVRRLLFLPVETATGERSFSKLKRILTSERCRLTVHREC